MHEVVPSAVRAAVRMLTMTCMTVFQVSFARLPETFTSEDVMRCFGLTSDGAVRSKTRRLISDHLIEKVSDGRGTTTGLSTFRKTGVQML